MARKPLIVFGALTDVQYANCDNKVAWYDPNMTRYYRNALTQVDQAYTHWKKHGEIKFILQLGDLLDELNNGCNFGLKAVLDKISMQNIPTYHTVGNHELYNYDRMKLAEHFTSAGDTFLEGSVFCYSFRPVKGVKFISLDCFEISILGYSKNHENYIKAYNILKNYHNHAEDWGYCYHLDGLDKRFNSTNGAISKIQLDWLHKELTESDERSEIVIVYGHVALCPKSASPDCLLWNYQEVIDLFHQHNCVFLYLCGHTHKAGYSRDSHGVHYMALAGIVETPPDSLAFSTISVYSDRLEVVGCGREETRTLPITPRIIQSPE